MKQKDKKRTKKYTGRLKNICLPDLDILDDEHHDIGFKSSRSAHKRNLVLKSDTELRKARVIEVMSNYQCRINLDDKQVNASIGGRLKQFKNESSGILAVGDYVEVDITYEPDYRIENILPRRNSMIRYSGGSFQKEITLAANIDQIVITSSWRMPIFKPGLVDRYLIMAAKFNIRPILVLNKIDLCEDFDELEDEITYYKDSGIRVILTSVVDGRGMEELKNELRDKDSVFSGHSGAGKSSLINSLEPGLELLTAEISDFNEKGKHTTTQALMLPFSFGGYLIDTPGIKTLTLHQQDKEYIPKLFPGFDRFYPQCLFRDCTHIHEEGCAVLSAMEEGNLDPFRYESYRWIMDNI
ncbi:MAG: ribosome small subunit-dependent GTPase A [Candidatus Cloacimonetes bacterium]|nr:ribosome small subunit-dependent GTPase A [Candidatus Cloacimonadota bacterium]MDD2506279.1 ribosome small subunit-dependent GTPase A [Candidatus Cloacimonadota bacterium]MDD4559901.1 ribosome small subunit-dependent GTPase A [Candidatus Cloacimonadota bacterium]